MATQVSDASGKTRIRGGSPDDLAVIAQRAQAFTNASGTAIALSEGNLDEIICRARAGSNAPDVGTTMRVEGSFTGLCIQSGKELRCDDAETDTRVDTAAIRALGIRSMVVIPIKEEGRVVGVLAAFAPMAHAFTITHMAVLKTMADQISALLQRERKSRDEGFSPAPEGGGMAPVAAPAKPVAGAPVATPPVAIKPAASAAMPAPSHRGNFTVVPKLEPVKATVVADEIMPAPAKKNKLEPREEHVETKAAKADYRVSFGTLDAAAAPGKRPGSNMLMIGAVAVVILAGAGGFSYYKFHKPAAAQPQQESASSVAPASTQPPTASPSSVASVTAAQPTVVGNNSDANRKTDKNSAKTITPPVGQGKREEPQPRREEAQAKREETVALASGPSRISSAKDNSPAPESPAMSLGNVPASGTLSTLASPVSVSTPAMVAQSELEPVKVLKRVPPVYPIVAKQRRLSGTVVVEGIVGVDGKITSLKLDSGPPLFRDAAFDAVKQWQFTAAKLNGKPIEQPTKIRLDFNPQ